MNPHAASTWAPRPKSTVCCWTLRPVSYTHLDVYKRQAHNLYPADGLGAEDAAMVEFLAIGAHAVRRGEVAAGDRVLITGAGPIGLGAVSYTHLDVYKRQILLLPIDRAYAVASEG